MVAVARCFDLVTARPVALRALLFLNPNSHRGRRLAGEVRTQLAQHGVEIVNPGEAANGIDAVVVAGGDGTLARHIGRTLALDVPVGVVPLGTFNDLARTLGIPTDIGEACAVIAAGRVRRIDVAVVNDTYYVTEASMGLSSRLTRIQRTADKQRFGLLAVAASALNFLKYLRPFVAEIGYDGRTERIRVVQLTVANSYRFGGFITVEDAAIDDGLLDLYAVESSGIRVLGSLLWAILRRRSSTLPGLRTYRSRAFYVASGHHHRITADGEPAGKTPAEFHILPRALQILAP